MASIVPPPWVRGVERERRGKRGIESLKVKDDKDEERNGEGSISWMKVQRKEKLKMMSHVLMTVRLNSMQSVDQPQPVHGFEKIVVWGDEKKIRVGKSMSPGIGESIINVIKKFRDIFAYTVEQVKQKLRHQGVERVKAEREEVDKLLKAGFIRECQYSEWLANVVLVKKSSEKWRMCVDFTDLNKACPKDDYPLP
ncbi:uncharacterized protein LOC130808429 [Amaranthus tricolor]|uniref:uncharacterized protein LOC130808429 n=1 Tax=Amaranthus tricolor TaxID=29722 RepID=UPI002586C7AA|nr:uncharacterized protein LOC130808429 [Amaranthus tricolor]